MIKTYYRNEYTEKQWKALIDKAAELGCQVTYGRYGDRAEIDSTDRENTILQSTGKSVDDCAARSFWAEHIHHMLQESTDLRRWSPRDTAKAIARLSVRVRSQQSRSVSREQQVLNGQ